MATLVEPGSDITAIPPVVTDMTEQHVDTPHAGRILPECVWVCVR